MVRLARTMREELEAAAAKKDASRLDAIRMRLRQNMAVLESEIGQEIDRKKNYEAAAGQVRKLMFLDRLNSEIDSAYEEIE